eukprot:TRINITY_DN2349_c0_g3_i6.p1 TRINITY_DN2349_c0_g3~~TRINITY_DN2349_c0_g3_i6.p1  ORF type:complete len:470 (-),score=110.76 TRINITY_DN2349_c0_g3_i6:103-1512(-)
MSVVGSVSQRALARNQAGIEHLENGEYELALTEFTKAIFLQPQNAIYYMNRGDAYASLCDFHSAELNYRKAMQLDQTNQDVQDRLYDLLNLRAQVNIAHYGDAPRAYDLLEEALELSDSTFDAENVECLHRKAVCFVMLDHNQEALEILNRILHSSTAESDLMLFRSRLYRHMGKLKEAFDDAHKVSRLSPQDEETAGLLGDIARASDGFRKQADALLISGKVEDALRKIDQAMEVDPGDPKLRLKKAVLLRQQGNFSEALKELARSISEAGGEFPKANIQVALTFNDIAVKMCKESNFEQAITFLNKAIKIHENVMEYHLNRGDCYLKTGNRSLAMADYHKALELDPGAHHIVARLSIIHHDAGIEVFRNGKFSQAEYEFNKAISYHDRIAIYYVNRALSRQYQGNLEGTKDDLLKALELEPDNEQAKQLLIRFYPASAVNQIASRMIFPRLRCLVFMIIEDNHPFEL